MRWHVYACVLAFLSAPALSPAASQPRGASTIIENEAAYHARCVREMIAQSPGARVQADSICKSRWGQIVAAGPMADAILSITPAPGTPFDPSAVKGRLAAVKWAPSARQGTIASGQMGDIEVAVGRAPAPSIVFNWFRAGDTIPFDLQGALGVRGASLSMIACQYFGSGEGTRIYRVAGPGKAPFALRVAILEAAVASQSSTFTAAADFSAAMPTLAALRKDGSEWTPSCSQ